ncbi:MAG: hypothetical protein VKO00_08370 [Cyanobacteriota bacterium]|nr:hypothetical protein [Cyanobacteriota bacterium]
MTSTCVIHARRLRLEGWCDGLALLSSCLRRLTCAASWWSS